MKDRARLLLISIVPPQNDCGVRIVMYRHLVERNPFELHIVTNADWFESPLPYTKLRLPYLLNRLRKSRFGPRLASWVTDYENLVWSASIPSELDDTIRDFRPDVILTLAETGLSHIAAKAAKRHRLPLAGLFLDWFPVMKFHFGHAWTQRLLSRRYRALYEKCDLAFCTSGGMQEFLGPHPNSHVLYPMPGNHHIPTTATFVKREKFRLAYVGSVEDFYGRMLCSLIERVESEREVEITIVGPNADWPKPILDRARAKGIYLGFKPPEEAAGLLADANALLVVMSFEDEHRLFMSTSFTTKFLDYVAFGKPIILWGPEYCTPVQLVRQHGGALIVNEENGQNVVDASNAIATDDELRKRLVAEALLLREGLFNPDRLQRLFVEEIEKIAPAARPNIGAANQTEYSTSR